MKEMRKNREQQTKITGGIPWAVPRAVSHTNPRTIAAAIIFATLFGGFSGCSHNDLSAFFKSHEVDLRFEESRVLPQPPDTTWELPLTFIMISDTHVYEENTILLDDLHTKIEPEDDILLIPGDLTDTGSLKDFQALKGILDTVNLPFYTAIGNHDLFYDGWENYKTVLGPAYYSVGLGPVRLICLDSANATLGAPQLDWLEDELKTKTEPFCIVMTHNNISLQNEFRIFQITDPLENYHIMSLFEEYNVDYVFSGHIHAHAVDTINGVTYAVLDSYSGSISVIPQQIYRLTLREDESGGITAEFTTDP